MLLLSLVGEQPIPNLLPARFLKRERNLLIYTQQTERLARHLKALIPESETVKLKSDPYYIEKVYQELKLLIENEHEVEFNLTGGTKIMGMAAFSLAAETGSPFCYLQSEGQQSLLHRFIFQNGHAVADSPADLPELINARDYLLAHLDNYNEGGYSDDSNGGGTFERAIGEELKKAGYEVLAGIRPERVKNQIEIDLIVRYKNQVAICEVKLGDAREEKPKQGIDQLNTAAGREYLGIYAIRVLINGRRLSTSIKTLAQERDIKTIELPDYYNSRLSQKDINHLKEKFQEIFRQGRYSGR